MRLGDKAAVQVEVIPTGAISLDIALVSEEFPVAGSLRSTDRNHPVRLPWPCI